jgi:hypothetical protein
MQSGIDTHPDLKEVFERLEKRSKPTACDYVVMGIEETGGTDMVVLLDSMDKGACAKAQEGKGTLPEVTPIWQMLTDSLKKHEAAFGCGYYDYTTRDGRAADKLVYVYYCSNDSSPRIKMKYTATSKSVVRKIKSINLTVGANDHEEMSYDSINPRVLKL